MAILKLINKQVFYNDLPIDDYAIEKIIRNKFPKAEIRFIEDENSVTDSLHNKSAIISHLLHLQEGEFNSIEEWEKDVQKTLTFLEKKLSPEISGLTQTKESDIL